MSISSHFYSALNRIAETAYPYVKDATTTQVATTAVGVVFGLYLVPQIVCCLCCSKKMKEKKIKVEEKESHFAKQPVFEERDLTQRTSFKRTGSGTQLYGNVEQRSRTNGSHWVPDDWEVERVVAVFSDEIVTSFYKQYAWFIRANINVNASVTRFAKLKSLYLENLFMVSTSRKESFLLHVVDNVQLFDLIHKQSEVAQENDLGLPLVAHNKDDSLLFFKCNEDGAHSYAQLMSGLFLSNSYSRPINFDE